MPATPAWPPKSLPRLFVRTALREGERVELDQRRPITSATSCGSAWGASCCVRRQLGEWLARIAEAGKKRMTLTVERRTREPETIPDVWLAFAPVKRAQTDWLVEKATELGAARLIPVMTQRTIAERVKLERLDAIAIEAAEQCGRTVLPEIAEPVAARTSARSERDPQRRLYFADESGGDPPVDRVRSRARRDPDRPRRRLHDEERAPVRAAPNSSRRSRSAPGSCAPKRPPSPRSRPSWRSRATGGHINCSAISRETLASPRVRG